MKKILTLILMIFFSSCSFIQENPKLIIENNSNVTFDSIKAYTSVEFPTNFYSINPSEKVEGYIKFNPEEKNDGCYKFIIYQQGNKYKETCFGYYTNGSSLNKEFHIKIETDTIKIESK